MKIQINSDNNIAVDPSLTQFVEDEVSRALDRFDKKLTRVEVHLSDADSAKTSPADKRCLIEVRPAGAQPRTATANASEIRSAISGALGKMKRSLTTFFGRKGQPGTALLAPASTAKKTVAKKTTARVETKARVKGPAKAALAKKQTKLSPRGPKKKGIYRARRKSWPAR